MHLFQEALSNQASELQAQPFPTLERFAANVARQIGCSIIRSFHELVRSSTISHKFAALLVAYGNIKIMSFLSEYLTSLFYGHDGSLRWSLIYLAVPK